ncbi:MAG: DNA polymerase III subunit gamma/tau [Verrucomicrobiota bacterium]
MSYQVIARKYRPQRFADVVGQEHVTQTLSNAIQQNRIAHAYLFVGPRGTGKTTLARIFAKCLNCTGGPKVDFSDDDPRCQEIAEGRSLDVLEIDGASNRGIEEVRELRETVKYAPATARFKIYIIDEVHMLTKEAFNALLKTLEEPPAHVKFMFATTEPEKVLPTILSRCQRFDLRRIPTGQIVQHLAHIAKLESVEIDEPALHSVARGADGGMRDAQSALDQLISFCGDHIVENDVLSMFGLTSRQQVFALARSILNGDNQTVLRQLDDLAKTGKDLARLLADLLNYFRNLLLLQVSNGDTTLLDASDTELTELLEQSRVLTTEVLTRIMDLLSETESKLRDAASKRILIEVALLKAIQTRHMVSIDSVLQKLQAARPAGNDAPKAKAPPAPPASAPVAVPPATQPPANPTAVAASTPSVRPAASPPTPVAADLNLAELWSKVVDAVGRASPFARTYLLEAHPVSLVRKVFTIGFDPQFADHLSLVDNPKNRTLIQTKLHELGYPDVQVKFVQAEPPSGWVRPSPPAERPEPEAGSPMASTPAEPSVDAKPPKSTAPSTKETFKNDPLIKQALDLFRGQIVDVRA